MKLSYLVICILLLAVSVNAQTKSNKRGVCYGYHSEADMLTASQFISWWYNWAALPDAGIRNTYTAYQVDFAPQAWNAAGIQAVRNRVSQDTAIKYILGFNEPNFKDQANMTPTQAAAAWPQLQAIADEFGLKLVSPAVNYCGNCVSQNGITYNNPFDWLDDFFAACHDCRVDYIALHWYGGGNSMSSYIDDARKYGKPIWVTEFANWDQGVTSESQKSYLAGTVNFLERDPEVFRYSWFIGRGEGATVYPFIDLYAADGTLTALGKIYSKIPVYDSSFVQLLPGRIEAEEYYRQKGVFAELTSDADGFMNIGYTENGDWLEYRIQVAEAGNYALTCRYAGTAAGQFDVLVDGAKKASVYTSNTNGWQNWKSVTVNTELPAGEHTLRLQVITKGFNLNWLEFNKGTAGNINGLESDASCLIFPNPVTEGRFFIKVNNIAAGCLKIELRDVHATCVFEKEVCDVLPEIEVDFGAASTLPKGTYMLSVIGKNILMHRKLVVL